MVRICEKCHKEYSGKFVHNGKIKHLGIKRKFCLECSPYNTGNRMNLRCNDLETKTCPICKIRKSRKLFTFSGSYCKECNSEIRKRDRKSNKERLINYKGGKCEICGYNKCIDALTFHHKEPSQKEFGIGEANSLRFPFEKMIKEADKCMLLCFNCHAETHNQLRIDKILDDKTSFS